MNFWVMGYALLLGILTGMARNGKKIRRQPVFARIKESGGKKRKNFRIIYLQSDPERSDRRSTLITGLVALALLGLLFFRVGHLSVGQQLLPAFWSWYFSQWLTARLTSPDFMREPAMVLCDNGLWVKDSGAGDFRHADWKTIKQLRITESLSAPTRGRLRRLLSNSRRVEIYLDDGKVIVREGASGKTVSLADMFGQWLPVRNIKTGQPGEKN